MEDNFNCFNSRFIYCYANILFSKKQKKEQQEELDKIKKYGETINQFTRNKNK